MKARIVFECTHCSVPLDGCSEDEGSVPEEKVGSALHKGMSGESCFGMDCVGCRHRYYPKIIRITYPQDGRNR